MPFGLSTPATTMTGVLLTCCLLGFLTFYGWLSWRSSKYAILTTQPFGLPDALWAGILGLLYIWMITCSVNTVQVINLKLIVVNLILNGMLIMGIFGVIGFQKNSAVTLFGLQPSRFPKAAAMGLLWLLITYPLIQVVQTAVEQLSSSADDSQQIVHYFLEHPDFRHRAAIIFLVVVIAPLTEEIIFRGYFYGVMRRYGGRIPALLTSSLLFAAIHVHLPSFPGLFLLALSLCLLYERTGSLWATITMHATFNSVTLLVLIFWPSLAT